MISYLYLKTMVVINDLVDWDKRNISKIYEVFKDGKERDTTSGSMKVVPFMLLTQFCHVPGFP